MKRQCNGLMRGIIFPVGREVSYLYFCLAPLLHLLLRFTFFYGSIVCIPRVSFQKHVKYFLYILRRIVAATVIQ